MRMRVTRRNEASLDRLREPTVATLRDLSREMTRVQNMTYLLQQSNQ